jgi:hypothetical protein
MANAIDDPKTAVAAETTEPAAGTHYAEVAARVNDLLAAVITELGPLEKPYKALRTFVRTNVGVDVRFIASVIAAVESNPELQIKGKFDVAEAHDVLLMIEALDPIVTKLEVLKRELKFTLDARKAKIAWDGRQIYAVSKRFARDADSQVAAHVEIMQRELGASGHPRKAKAPAPTTPPSTPLETAKEEPKP